MNPNGIFSVIRGVKLCMCVVYVHACTYNKAEGKLFGWRKESIKGRRDMVGVDMKQAMMYIYENVTAKPRNLFGA